MNTQSQIPKKQLHPFDLEDRTAKFGEQIVLFAKSIAVTEVTKPLISQIVRSGTSIGANYMEADGSESKKDFRHNIARCKKEAKETRHWLRMLSVAFPDRKDDLRILWKEAEELTRIFSAILRK